MASAENSKRQSEDVGSESDAKKVAGVRQNNVSEWIEENKSSFLPPVCNKLMYNDQLKIMFIGGPNVRKDYHMEEGEEWFYQLKGDMVLKIMEKGKHKDVVIKEGECFRLPPRIPHSPQRFENTVGLVIERERSTDERDGLRYYVDNSTDILWEEWFYCYDLGTQLGPVIKKFFASEEYKTGQPPKDKVFGPPPFELDITTEVDVPFTFKQWISDNKSEIEEKGSKDLLEGGEFKITVWGDADQKDCYEGDVFLWQLEGESELTRGDGTVTLLNEDSCIVISPEENFSVVCKTTGGRRLAVKMDPLASKPKK